ncbi:hypothetical protein [Sphingomonas sp. Leaf25]|uniref:hypothetical protein n=1 Tax=Sphingomonas sp. Leaf25 TaxID=1735692 RepID=UPI0006FEACCD|nr:hypothetical protein [Sphingomonas sp. Leaf25]KQN06909.1 hypothetical protein ASE78_14905 [Sphingomonas sp. Leaf25]
MGTFGFGTLGKLVMVGIMAPAFYLVISQGAAERARVEAVERSIVQARKEIRDLETEFDTRANLAQLERWNGDVLALASPRAEQYVGGEHQLASLPGRTESGNVALAYVVPAAPMEYIPAPTEPAAAPVTTPAVATSAAATPAVSPRATTPAPAAKAAPRPTGPVQTAAVAHAKARAVAMLDRTLLSDSTLGDLSRSARREATLR